MKVIDLEKILEPYKKYEDKWVALNFSNTKILGSGNTLKEAIENAKKNSNEEPVAFKVPSAKALVVG